MSCESVEEIGAALAGEDGATPDYAGVPHLLEGTSDESVNTTATYS